jgi:predicted ATPase
MFLRAAFTLGFPMKGFFVWPRHDSTPQFGVENDIQAKARISLKAFLRTGMKLKKIHVREFKSIVDSNEFDVTDITCLVGKNEAGKTAILQALYKLNPIVPEHAHFDVTEEYPRAHVDDYLVDVEQNKRNPAQVIQADFALDEEEIATVEKEFGRGCLLELGHQLHLSNGYSNNLCVTVDYDEPQIVKNLIADVEFSSEEVRTQAQQTTSIKALQLLVMADSKPHPNGVTATEPDLDSPGGRESPHNGERLDEKACTRALLEKLTEYIDKGLHTYIYQTYLQERVPRFLYFDEFYQMEGQVNVEALKARQTNNQLLDSDRPMLGLMELARVNVDQLDAAANTQDLVRRMEGAGNFLSRRLLDYWSQNQHIQLRFDVRPGHPGDPPGYQSGTNVWVNVYDSTHWVTVRIGTRSRGFIWFFSFLAWFFQQQKSGKPMILLMDEPGVFLHASAQRDLLRFIEKELNGQHQVIYTTHSSFMIDSAHLDRVRIVCDHGMKDGKLLPKEQEGTKVFADPVLADSDSLSPLQGTLAYHSMHALIGSPNTLAIEAVSDMFYIQGMTDLLERAGKIVLSEKWTLMPVGGVDKVSIFTALVGELNLAVLIDYQKKDQQTIEHLCKQKLLKQSRVFTFADFTGAAEADIEDMFDPEFYLELINGEYKDELTRRIFQGDLPQHPRIAARLEQYFQRNPLKNNLRFNQHRPARYFVEHFSELAPKISAKTQERFEAAFDALNKLLEPAKERSAGD